MKQPIDLAGIRARADAATPGPWARKDVADYAEIIGFSEDPSTPVALVASARDADYIAHACQDIPALLDEVERLQGLLDDMEGYKLHSKRISECPSCNDCAQAKECDIKPRLGEICRINCHLWRGFSEREGG